MTARADRPGRYRRATRLVAEPRSVTVEMEDDIHHFGLHLAHDGAIVRSVIGTALRTPYSTCPSAVDQLGTLHGMPLAQAASLPAALRFEHCMHLYDLVALAARHAGDVGLRRLYRIEVDHDVTPPVARLWRDAEEILVWGIAGGRIVGSPFDSLTFRDLDARLAQESADMAEAARLLRRASLISFVRRYDWESRPVQRAIEPASPANCYAKQPQRRDAAERIVGDQRDFSGAARWPLDGGPVLGRDG